MLIRSERLRLRAARDEEAKDIVAMFDSDHVIEGYDPRWPVSLASVLAALRDPAQITLVIEVRQHIAGYVQAALSWGDGVLTIRDFLMGGDFFGQGYGSEALAALLQFFFGRWRGRRVELQVRADNDRALRCYRRVGFTVEGRRREVIPREWGPAKSPDYLMLGILIDEWRAAYTRSGPRDIESDLAGSATAARS